MPPKGNADLAWVQHMIKSMKLDTGRMAVVLPHGALFRKGAEGRIRKALLEMDLLDAVIGLGANIFYGRDFREEIRSAINESAIVLVIIDRFFITEERRLFDQEDYVRYEITYL